MAHVSVKSTWLRRLQRRSRGLPLVYSRAEGRDASQPALLFVVHSGDHTKVKLSHTRLYRTPGGIAPAHS
jgi:hypothetical protein